jgi:hypothetical protein
MWGRGDAGAAMVRRAVTCTGVVDEPYLAMVLYQLREFEAECGDGSAEAAVEMLTGCLKANGHSGEARWLHASYLLDRATRDIAAGRPGRAIADVAAAVHADPTRALSRDPYTCFFRSAAGLMRLGPSGSTRLSRQAVPQPPPGAWPKPPYRIRL